MEFILWVAFIIVVVVGTKLHKKRLANMSKSTQTNKPTGGTVSGDTSSNGNTSGRRDDGSVSPPGNEQNEI